MRNLGFFLSLCLLLAAPAAAAETEETASPASAETSQTAATADTELPADEDELPIEILPPEEMPPLDVEASPRPECSDLLLVQKIVEKIEAYQTEHPSTMLIDRRRDILLRRNLSRFDEVKVEGFTAKQDFNVANAVIMTKINRGLNDADLRLCKSLGHGRAAGVYALIYPVGEGNVVDIINFLPGENLSFIYD